MTAASPVGTRCRHIPTLRIGGPAALPCPRSSAPQRVPSQPAHAVPQTWDYEQGTVLTDPSGVAFGDYYGRLVAHYVEGGFVDEAGVFRPSPYRFNISCVRAAAAANPCNGRRGDDRAPQRTENGCAQSSAADAV